MMEAVLILSALGLIVFKECVDSIASRSRNSNSSSGDGNGSGNSAASTGCNYDFSKYKKDSWDFKLPEYKVVPNHEFFLKKSEPIYIPPNFSWNEKPNSSLELSLNVQKILDDFENRKRQEREMQQGIELFQSIERPRNSFQWLNNLDGLFTANQSNQKRDNSDFPHYFE